MKQKPMIWIVDDDASMRWVLDKALTSASWRTQFFENAGDVLTAIESGHPDAIITDIRMPGASGLDLVRILVEKFPTLPVIVMTAYTDMDNALAAYREGAFEYLPKPFDLDDAVALVRQALEKKGTPGSLPPAESAVPPHNLIGKAESMQTVFRVIGRLAGSHINVLICGESGTGKELVARAIYANSPRSGAPFVAINTAAISAELLESELFGHEKGAFTDAHARREGRFEQARGGTLFLDEIGDMPVDLQARLLRVLSDGTFYRVGGHEELRANVRVIAATNQDLESQVRDGRVREDLYHRLNVMTVTLPPLRDRYEDIETLAQALLSQAAQELSVEPKQLDRQALAMLRGRPWRGNVRELENLCRQLTVMAPGRVISLVDLPAGLKANSSVGGGPAELGWESLLEASVRQKLKLGENAILSEVGPRFERVLLRTALAFTGGRKQEAARRLGWGRNTLTRKLKELEIDGLQ